MTGVHIVHIGGRFMNSHASDVLVGLLYGVAGFVIAVILFIAFLVWAALFIIQAVGMYRIAQRKGITHAWLAWIPGARKYLYAEIIGTDLKVGQTTIPQFPWIYIAVTFGSFLISAPLNAIPVVGTLLSMLLGLALFAVEIYLMYRFFKLFEGENTVVFTVICAILGFVFPFLVLYLRNKPFAAGEIPTV